MEPSDGCSAPGGPREAGHLSRSEQATAIFETLCANIATAQDAQRYELVADLLKWCVEKGRPAVDGQASSGGASLARRVQEVEKLKADLEDALRTTRADLAIREKQLEAEQIRARELQTALDNQRAKLDAAQQNQATLEAQLVEKNNALHVAESAQEALLLKFQRAQMESGDRSQLDALERERSQLIAQLDSVRSEMEHLRNEKNAEIDRLQGEITGSAAGSAKEADALLTGLWDRLASTQPPLSHGGIQPTSQAAERMVDTLIELATFVCRFDADMRIFLDKYTKYNPSVGRPWKIYAERDDFQQIIRQTLEPSGNRNVGILRAKLKFCQKWALAAMVGADTVVESLASELQSHLLGEVGAGGDPRCTIRDYVKRNGPDLFLEHMLKLRGDKLAEVYGYGV